MTTATRAQDALSLFNEKAQALLDSRFGRAIGSPVGVQVQFVGGGPAIVTPAAPELDDILAFVLTLRFFIQNNEPSCIHRVSALYAALSPPQDLKGVLASIYKAHTTFLEAPSHCYLDDRRLTNCEILDVFVFGEMAHSTKKTVHDRWKSATITYAVLMVDFIRILYSFLRVIVAVRDLNLKVLDHFRQRERTSTP